MACTTEQEKSTTEQEKKSTTEQEKSTMEKEKESTRWNHPGFRKPIKSQ